MWISKYINLLASFCVGITFLFSGLAKVNDPLGFAYKIEEYLYLLASHLTAHIRLLLPYTLVLAVGIATLEVVLGVALLIHWQYLWMLRILLLFTLFFTCLTLYTATSRRIASCGCFGDALVLTPWQSFAKSGILLLLLGGLLESAKDDSTSLHSYYGVGGALLLALSLVKHTLDHLPLLDFLPYQVGNDLTATILENTDPSIHFCTWQGEKETSQTFLRGNKLLVIVQNPASIDRAVLRQLYELLQQLQGDLLPVLITPTGQSRSSVATLALPCHTVHPLLLRNMLRAKVGLLLLRDGLVVEKWNFNDITQARKTLNRLGWLHK